MNNLGFWERDSAYRIYSIFFEECAAFSFKPIVLGNAKIGEKCYKIDIENVLKMAVNMIDNGEESLRSAKLTEAAES